MRIRHGFTVVELLAVLVMGTILLAAAAPAVSRSLTQTRVQRAAAAIAADLQLAHTLAARQRVPVRITVQATERIGCACTVARRRTRCSASAASTPRRSTALGTGWWRAASAVTVFPNGMASGPLTLTLEAGGSSRIVSMTRVGQVRVR
jgi:prepilin-type N-terminal cleavage/methylation domain-containing protein